MPLVRQTLAARHSLAPLVVAVAAVTLVAAGCTDLLLGTGCDAAVYRAVDVEVRDARTGAWIAAGARGEIQDGEYVDTLRSAGGRADTITTLGAGLGRKGTYAVRVRHPGYRPWEQRGVRAAGGRCGVRTTRLTARLTPSGA